MISNFDLMMPSMDSGGGGGGMPIIPGIGGMNNSGLAGNNILTGKTSGSDVSTINPIDWAVKPIFTSGTSGIPGLDNSTSGLPASLLGSVGATTIPTTPTSFSANTAGTVPGTALQDLNLGSLLGFGTDPNQLKQLQSYYGPIGTALYNFLSGGAGYNPAVGTALINQMAPQEERARNSIMESFGASGGRYSSPAAIGLGDYESSFSLGQQAILANLANSATDRYSNLFGGILDTAHLEQANKLGLGDILSNILKALGGSGLGSKGSGAQGNLGSLINAIKNKITGQGNKPPGLPGSIPPAGQNIIDQMLQDIINQSQIPGFDMTNAINLLQSQNIDTQIPGGADAQQWLNDLLSGVQDPGSVSHTITDTSGNPIPGSPGDTSSIDWFSPGATDWLDTGNISDWLGGGDIFGGGGGGGGGDFGGYF